jgi:hypothetical protein
MVNVPVEPVLSGGGGGGGTLESRNEAAALGRWAIRSGRLEATVLYDS